MILPNPFVAIVVDPAASARFNEVLGWLQTGDDRPGWSGFATRALLGTRVEPHLQGGNTHWLRVDGAIPEIHKNPYPGIQIYVPGDDAPVTLTDGRGTRAILPLPLVRFVERLAVGVEPAADPTPAPRISCLFCGSPITDPLEERALCATCRNSVRGGPAPEVQEPNRAPETEPVPPEPDPTPAPEPENLLPVSMRAAALALWDRGFWPVPNWWVLPDGTCACPRGANCTSPGKHPVIRWREMQQRRLTREETDIWFATYPRANVGIVTGPLPGIICIDVDVKEGVDGTQTLSGHAAEGRTLPETFCDARGPGLHLYYSYPDGLTDDEISRIRNVNDGALGPGVDIRAGGGQAVVAPSMHYSGERRRIVDDRDPVPAPRWLVDLILAGQQHGSTEPMVSTPSTAQRQGDGGVGLPDGERRRFVDAFVRKHYPGGIVAGGRHHAFMQAAGCLRMAGAGAEEIFQYLVTMNQTVCQPPKANADEELRDVSGYVCENSPAGTMERQIIISGRHLHDITADAVEALVAANDPPTLFVRGTDMVRVLRGDDGVPRISIVGENALRGLMSRCATYMALRARRSQDADGNVTTTTVAVPADPPVAVVRDVAALGEWHGLPSLRGLSECPVVRPDGSIMTDPGYDPVTMTYYCPPDGLVIPPVPYYPTPDDVRAAKETLIEPFIDFPFVDDSSIANALAVTVTAVVRPMIDGNIPFCLIDKPQAGTGASLVADVVSTVATGRSTETRNAPASDEEWRKKITSELIQGRTVVVLDNLETSLHAPALASLLTSAYWTDRLLGRSENVTIPNRSMWIGTGNNVQLGKDLPRRCYWVRLDARTARPWEREGYRHHPLLPWVREHRGEILAAILTLVRAWVADGRPAPPQKPIGSFETWTSIVGGILYHGGVRGFLGNLEAMYDANDTETPQWEQFLLTWREIWSDIPTTVADVVTHLIREEDEKRPHLLNRLPDAVAGAWGDPKGRSKFVRLLGRQLARKNLMRFPSGVYIERGGTSHNAVQWYVRLVPPGTNASAATTAQRQIS